MAIRSASTRSSHGFASSRLNVSRASASSGWASSDRSRPASLLQPGSPTELKNLVGRIAPRPILFIYGQHDQDNVRELAPRYYASAGKPKAIWEVPGAAHTGGIDALPREYERRVIAFFDHTLLTK
jgi:fermentation-respiration switch protein FrsA (DUF1100 family)